MAKRRCPYCGKWFTAKPGRGKRQVTCLHSECQSAHKKVLDRKWHTANPERTLGRRKKINDWASGRNYWHDWRLAHADYVERNRRQTCERMRKKREVQRQTRAILANPMGYLRGLKADVCKTRTGGPRRPTRNGVMVDDVCKTRSGDGVLVGMVDYMIAREMFAKHENLGVRGAVGG